MINRFMRKMRHFNPSVDHDSAANAIPLFFDGCMTFDPPAGSVMVAEFAL